MHVTRMNYRQPSASCVQSSLFGEPSTAHLIAAARLRRVSWSYVHLIEHADLGADPIPELEFEQTLGWKSCAVEMAHTAERGLVWIGHWGGAMNGVGCQFRIVGSVQFPPGTRIKSLVTPNKSGL